MRRQNYTVDEFLAHFSAMQTVQEYTEVRKTYAEDAHTLHVGQDRGEMGNIFRVLDYFAQISHPHQPDIEKASALMGAMYWVGRHTGELIEAGCARREEKEGLVGFPESTLRALFEACEAIKWETRDVDAARVIARARQLREELGEA